MKETAWPMKQFTGLPFADVGAPIQTLADKLKFKLGTSTFVGPAKKILRISCR